jgi:photosystem II stability/assembly factor-like uncharacterized protein
VNLHHEWQQDEWSRRRRVMSATVYAGTVGQSVWRSRDGGETWARASKGMMMECEVRALVAHPRESERLYAGTDDGCWHSPDGGESWQRLESPMDGMQIWSLAIDPRRPERLFAGTCPAALFRSEDGGRRWQRLSAPMATECAGGAVIPRVTCIALDPEREQTMFAGVEIDGVRRSDDGGETWATLNEGLTTLDIHGFAALPGPRPRLVATTNQDIFLSDDRGASWRALRVREQLPWSYCRGLIVAPDDPNTLYAGIGNGPPGSVGGLARSRDRGETWETVSLPVTPNSTIWCLAANATDPSRLYISSISGQLFRSTDRAATWQKLPHEFGEVRALLWLPE